MGGTISKARGKTVAISCLTLAALMLSFASNVGHGHASGRLASASRAASGVFVEPFASQTLWVGTLDPALATSLLDSDFIFRIYAGLLKQSYNDKTGKFNIVPDLAAAMPTISKNGLVYTFKIRPDAKFSDGTPVTAQDFVWSFQRVLDPKAHSGAAYYLFNLKGASDFNAGTIKSFSQVGVKALDARTLQITLAAPASYFLYALTYNTGLAVKSNLPIGAKLATDPSLVVGAGPWMIKNHTWKYRSEITLVPNPYYYGAKNFKIKEQDLYFTSTFESMLAAYKSGQYPMAWLPSIDVATYRGTPEFHDVATLGDVWYSMNVHIAPFDNIHFRRAIAYAIDRNAITAGVYHGTVHPQLGWYPQGILGYDPNITKQPGVPYYNPTIAKQELAMAMKTMKTVPPITLEYRTENPDVARETALVQQELKATLGINISLKGVPRPTWITDGNSGKTQFIWSDWYDDYPDPQDFSDYLIRTGAPENWARYSNPTVDHLFDLGNVATDAQKRAALYKQAQLIVLRDAAVTPIYQFAQQTVISTKYHGIELNPSWGNQPQPVGNDWANVSVSQ
jgi:ABC-type oligopeptide transport system substrate-binding subunit